MNITEEQAEEETFRVAGQMGAAVPGISLTRDPEQPYPWEGQPEFTELKEALEYYFVYISEEEKYGKVIAAISNGVPIMDITKMFLYEGFQEGLFNPDLMMLLVEPLAYMIMAFAENLQVDYVIEGDEDEEETNEPQALAMMDDKIKNIENIERPEELPENMEERMTSLLDRR